MPLVTQLLHRRSAPPEEIQAKPAERVTNYPLQSRTQSQHLPGWFGKSSSGKAACSQSQDTEELQHKHTQGGKLSEWNLSQHMLQGCQRMRFVMAANSLCLPQHRLLPEPVPCSSSHSLTQAARVAVAVKGWIPEDLVWIPSPYQIGAGKADEGHPPTKQAIIIKR